MDMVKRILYILIGTILLGAAMGMYINTGLGSDAFSIFVEGGSMVTHFKPGTISILLNSCFLISNFFLDKKKIGVGTLVALVCTKWPLDFACEHFVSPQNFVVRCIIDVLLCACFGVACALIAKGNLGTTAYDGFTLSITKLTGKKYTTIRYIADGFLFLAGWLMGGTIGVGSIIAVICSGPFFNFFLKVFKVEK